MPKPLPLSPIGRVNDPADDLPHREMVERSAVGTLLIDVKRRICYANSAFAAMVGSAPAALVGRNIAEFVAPGFSIDHQQMLDMVAAATGHAARLECCYRTARGATLWVLATATRLSGAQSERILVQAVSIEDRKRTEQALATSESRWNFALEGAGQGVWDHDLVRNKVFYSRTWRHIRGFGPDEDVDAEMGPWFDRLHPEDREKIRLTTQRQNTGELKVNAFEYRERHRDGHWIWILSRGKAVEWLPDGSVARILGTDTDITSLKLIESQLAEEKERLKVTLQSIGDGMISTDSAGTITFLNPAAEEMTGVGLADAIGRPVHTVFDLRSPDAAPLPLGPIENCLRSKGVVSLSDDVLLFSRDGGSRYIHCTASPVRTPDDGVIGTVVVFRDTTQAQLLKHELAHYATHDPLTGLPNRVGFERALSVLASSAQHTGREHALCFIDLDRFKRVNDGAGHAAGDQVLRVAASHLTRRARKDDVAARVGGDEFTLLLPDCNLAEARAIAQDIVDSIAALRFTFGGRDYQIGASVGVTAVTRHPISTAVFIGEADAACYAAKAGGRGRVVLYQEGSLAAEGRTDNRTLGQHWPGSSRRDVEP